MDWVRAQAHHILHQPNNLSSSVSFIYIYVMDGVGVVGIERSELSEVVAMCVLQYPQRYSIRGDAPAAIGSEVSGWT